MVFKRKDTLSPAPLFKKYGPLQPKIPPKEVLGPVALSTPLRRGWSFSLALGVPVVVMFPRTLVSSQIVLLHSQDYHAAVLRPLKSRL